MYSKFPRFPWHKVIKIGQPDGCWIWTGRVENGYGRLGSGKNRKQAHVLAWEERYGPVPKGMELHHISGNRQCVNIDGHLACLSTGEHMKHHNQKEKDNGIRK